MSMDYVIKIKIDASYEETPVRTVLARGAEKGFVYYDYVFGELYKHAPVIGPAMAATKIINAYENKIEGGPSVLVVLNEKMDTNVFFWFYRTEDNLVEFTMGDFTNPQKRGYYIDFAYYIRMSLDLCDDFGVLEVTTIMF